MKRTSLALLGLLALAAPACADTITVEFDESGGGIGVLTGSFTMTPGDWFSISNVDISGDTSYAGHLWFNGYLPQFTVSPTPSSAGFIAFASGNPPSPYTPSHLSVSFTQQIVNGVATGSYTATASVGFLESYSVQAWDYFEGSMRDNVTGAPIVAGVPEPSTWLMLLLGFVGLAWAFRKRLGHHTERSWHHEGARKTGFATGV